MMLIFIKINLIELFYKHNKNFRANVNTFNNITLLKIC